MHIKTIISAITLLLIFACKEDKKLPVDIILNENYQENLIRKDEVKINIPIGWRVYSDQEKDEVVNDLNANSQYKLTVDYFLRLNSDALYPSASVNIRKSSEIGQLSFEDFAKQFVNIYSDIMPTVLDGAKSIITNHNEIGNYIDKKNKTLYIINEAQVSNQGRIKTISAMILKKDYLIGIVFTTKPEEFEKYLSAFNIMVNSTRL